MTENGKECKTLDTEISRRAKEFNEICAITGRKSLTDNANRHNRIRKITGQKLCSSASCIKSKEGTLIIDKEKTPMIEQIR